MSVTPLPERSQPELLLDLLMNGLRVREARLNEVASELLTRFGTLPARRLVAEAVREKNRPAHRLRALAVLARIADASGLDVLDVMDLNLLRFARNGSVREAAHRFFGTTERAGTKAGTGAAG